MTDKEIYEQLWYECETRDKVDYLIQTFKEAESNIKDWSNYTDRIVIHRDNIKILIQLLEGLNKP